MKNVLNVKITGIKFSSNISNNYRTTKGGKKILTDSPSYYMCLTINIEPDISMSVGDHYQYMGIKFRYIGNALVSNTCTTYSDFSIDSDDMLTLYYIGRYYGE